MLTTAANGPLIGMGTTSTTFITFTASPVPGTGTILAVTDVTGDGKADAIVGNNTYFRVLTGTGTGSFSTGASIAITGGAQAAGDFDGDGYLDILSSSTTGGYIRLGNGNGTFKATGLSFAIAASNVAYAGTGDFNADGHLDIVALRTTYSSGQINYQTASGSLTTEAELVNLSTVTQARIAMDNLDLQLGRIDSEVGIVGAALSRLTSAAQNLTTLRENYQVAASNIKDADVATETAELVRLKILQQGSTAVLAQANSSPQMLLKLLEGET